MTSEQFGLIIDAHFPRLSESTVNACWSVIIDGMTVYAAETLHYCSRGTVGRYVNKIYSQYALAIEIAEHEESE